MHNVDKPVFSVKDILSHHVTKVRTEDKEYIEIEEHNYNTLFLNFASKIPNRQTLGSLSKDELIKLYENLSEDKVTNDYYKKIKNSSNYCPICGIERPSQVDHFFPKNDYTSLSIVPNNLVPICTICNMRRKRKKKTWNGNVYFHPYFHTISYNWYEIALVPGTANCFKCICVIKPTDRNYRYVEYTIDSLGLIDRITDMANILFNEMIEEIAADSDGDIEKVKKSLKNKINPYAYNNIRNEMNKCILKNIEALFSIIKDKYAEIEQQWRDL